jgi:hypothetical protein
VLGSWVRGCRVRLRWGQRVWGGGRVSLRAWVFKTVGKAEFRDINRILHVFDYDISYCEAYILTQRSTSVAGFSRITAFPHIQTYTTTTVLQASSNLGYTVSSNPYNFTTMPASAPSKSVQATETEAFERELAALTAYADGWDRWDGPVWPVGYEQCRLRRSRLGFPFFPSYFVLRRFLPIFRLEPVLTWV